VKLRRQKGSLKRKRRDGGEMVWIYRWREIGPDGTMRPRKKVIGTAKEFTSEAAARQEVERLDFHINLDRSAMAPHPRTIAELVEHFKATEMPETEDPNGDGRAFATKNNARSYFRRWIVPQWGDYALSEIRTVEVEAWLKSLILEPCKRWPDGKRLANGSKKKIRDLMHVLYQHARRHEWTDRNPISLVRQSGKREEIPTLLSLEDLAKLIYDVLGLRERTMVLLDFATAMRRGELSGNKWEDISFLDKVLHIRRSIVNQRIGKPKTELSKKPVPLSDEVIACLLEWRAQTPYSADTDYVFASAAKKGAQPLWMSRVMQHWIKPAAEKAGITGLKGWHTLRRSYASILQQHHNDPKVVQEALRHASSRFCLDVYAQAITEEKRAAHNDVIDMLVNIKKRTAAAAAQAAAS